MDSDYQFGNSFCNIPDFLFPASLVRLYLEHAKQFVMVYPCSTPLSTIFKLCLILSMYSIDYGIETIRYIILYHVYS